MKPQVFGTELSRERALAPSTGEISENTLVKFAELVVVTDIVARMTSEDASFHQLDLHRLPVCARNLENAIKAAHTNMPADAIKFATLAKAEFDALVENLQNVKPNPLKIIDSSPLDDLREAIDLTLEESWWYAGVKISSACFWTPGLLEKSTFTTVNGFVMQNFEESN